MIALNYGYVWVARANGMHEILFMIRGRPRNGGDDVDVGIDVDDETRDEECSLLEKSLSVSRTFDLPELWSCGPSVNWA